MRHRYAVLFLLLFLSKQIEYFTVEQQDQKSDQNGTEGIKGLIGVSANKNTREQSDGCGWEKPSPLVPGHKPITAPASASFTRG